MAQRMACLAGRETKEEYSLTVGSSHISLLASWIGFLTVWRVTFWPELLISWVWKNVCFLDEDAKNNLKRTVVILYISLRILNHFNVNHTHPQTLWNGPSNHLIFQKRTEVYLILVMHSSNTAGRGLCPSPYTSNTARRQPNLVFIHLSSVYWGHTVCQMLL